MEARLGSAASKATVLVGIGLVLGCPAWGLAAGYRSANFSVSAPTPQLAKEIGDCAEACRRDLAIAWLGQELPNWSKPCPIHAKVGPRLGAGGATSFVFDRGEVFDWKMNIQGSRERILDSVLPHEVTHTIFASHFRKPVPRWADEGACTTVEHRSEVAKQERMLIDFLKTRRGIPFDQMFMMKDYPSDVMPLYSQGHSLAQWLIESRGRKAFLTFLADGMRDENWRRAVREHYGFDGLNSMQNAWLEWVKQGRPPLTPETSPITQLVSNSPPARPSGPAATSAILRAQSPDDITPIGADSEKSATATDAGSRVVVASAGGSVYAAMVKHVEREANSASAPAAGKSSATGPSVYDASLGTSILRR
jgi:hypothetical protein